MKHKRTIRQFIDSVWYRVRDSHLVYGRILPTKIGGERVALVRRGFMGFTSKIWLMRVILVIAGDIVAIVRICRIAWARNSIIIVSEFSTYIYSIFSPILFVMSDRLILNVNHNLNKPIEALLLKIWISKFCSIGFIEPSADVMEKYTFITPIRLQFSNHHDTPWTRLYLFTGSREEQRDEFAPNYINLLLKNWPNAIVVGGNFGRELSEKEYAEAMQPGSAFVMLYSLNNYERRHSGVVLEALLNGAHLFMRKSALAVHYIERGLGTVEIYENINDLLSKLRERGGYGRI